MTRFFLLLFLYSSTLSFAQESKIHFKNSYARNKDTNILFWNDDNHVTLYATGLNAEELDVVSTPDLYIKISNAEKDTLKLYCNFPNSNGAPPAGKIKLIHSGTKKLAKEVPYSVYPIKDDFAVRLGSIRNSHAEKELILAQSGLRFVSADEVFDPNKFFRITSFTFSCNTSEMKYDISVRGGLLTQEIRDIIRSLRPNSKISFEYITAVGRAGRSRAFPDLEILVK